MNMEYVRDVFVQRAREELGIGLRPRRPGLTEEEPEALP